MIILWFFLSLVLECEQICLTVPCCWRSDVESCTNNTNCADYEGPCSLYVGLYGDAGAGSTSPQQGSSGSSNAGPSTAVTASEIAAACDTTQAVFVRVLCEQRCAPGGCCYQNGQTCTDGTDCSIYSPCQILNRRMLRQG